MNTADILKLKKEHINRLSSANGSYGEKLAIHVHKNWIERPKGLALANLLNALEEQGISIKRSSFDAISLPENISVDFHDYKSVKKYIDTFIFVEIKTTSKEAVKNDFTGYFFAFTESELRAAEQLGDRHCVALVNKRTANIFMTSIPELLNRAKSMTWQVSVQL